MAGLEISLFGRLQVRYDQVPLGGLEVIKVQELLCYVLLYRTRPHSRECLADILWSGQAGNRAKKYLRKVLWQLQSALTLPEQSTTIPLLHIDDEWIQFNSSVPCWIDIAEFERAFAQVEGAAGEALEPAQIDALQHAVCLYTGDLLEARYYDWSTLERERFRYMLLAMQEKLMRYYEAREEFEVAIGHGTRLLRHEPAHEPTHRRLMRIHLLLGNRAAALRQYEYCIAALERELDAVPSSRTQRLYAQIRLGELESRPADMDNTTLNSLYQRLKQIEATLAAAQHRVEQDAHILKLLMHEGG